MIRDFFSRRLIVATFAVTAAGWMAACSNGNTETIPGGTGSTYGYGGGGNPAAGGGSGFTIDTKEPTKDAGVDNKDCDDGGACYAVVDAGPYCGDGIIQKDLGEDCDDKNRVGGDGCSGICKVEPNWECPTAGEACKSLIVCGDGDRQTGEGCDDHNKNSGDGCDANCKVEAGWFCAAEDTPCQRLASCGDGRIANGESCDIGGDNGKGKGCDANCRVEDGWTCRPLPTGCKKVSVCGNNKVEADEDCDDGNLNSGDGCSNRCKIEGNYYTCPSGGGACTDKSRCGNGALEKQETCDDGNTNSDDGCSKDCKTEDGWQCRMAGKACVPFCGDGKITATENCDDGNDASEDGCSSTCLTEPGWACEGKTCTKSECGNGKVEAGETCDNGKESNGLFYGDGKGCSKSCTKEPNCRPNGTTQACSTACGDGNKDPGENCDDGNGVSGDGCSAKCEPEDGFVCKDTEVPDTTDCTESSGKCLVLPIIYRDFEGQQVSGGHPDFFHYGATASGGRTTGVATGASKTTCVPNAGGTKVPFPASGMCPSTDETGPCLGLVKDTLGSDGKPQYNKNTCPCVFTDWDKTGLLGTCPTGDSTANCTPTTGISGIVDCYVEGNGTHRLRIDTNVTVIQSADTFKQWYNDSSSSITVKRTLELALLSGNQYQYSSSNGRTMTDDIHDIFMRTGTVTSLQSGFFPLEDQSRTKICNLWPYWAAGMTSDATCVANDGNPVGSQWDPKASGTPGTAGTGGPVKPVNGKMRNFYFTSEVRYLFRYTGAGTLAFYGDDDVWVFINGKIALDLGAPHMRLQGSVNIDATKFDLQKDKIYEIAVFHADRHPRDSNYQLTLSGFSTNRSVCQPRCGDGKVTAGEECDDGDKNSDGTYNGCTKSCKFGPFCGDAEKNGSEECDDGKNTTVTSSSDSNACGPGCKFPPKCGDGKVQTGEQCDEGSSNTDQQCGGCSKSCTSNAICGDGKVDKDCGEECDDGANIGGYSYCMSGCKPDARCGDSKVDSAFGETCDLGDGKNGVAGSDGKVECTSTCGVPAVCGDKVVTAPETCDDGVNDGTYGGCTPDCQKAPYCGDSAKNGNEECDYGAANTPPTNALYGGCLTTCKLGPRCGDNVTQNPPEQCDTGGDSQTCSVNCVAKIKLF